MHDDQISRKVGFQRKEVKRTYPECEQELYNMIFYSQYTLEELLSYNFSHGFSIALQWDTGIP